MTLTQEDIEQYKLISGFLIGLETAERLENENVSIKVKKAETDTHWLRFLIFEYKKEDKWGFLKMMQQDKYDEIDRNTSTFTIYLNKFKYEVVVKANFLWAFTHTQKNDIMYKFSNYLRSKGFEKFKFEQNILPAPSNNVQSTIKVLIHEKSLDSIMGVYEAIKYYNEKMHPAIMENRKW